MADYDFTKLYSDPDCVVCYGCGMETEYYYYGQTEDEGVMPFCPECVGNR